VAKPGMSLLLDCPRDVHRIRWDGQRLLKIIRDCPERIALAADFQKLPAPRLAE
jgi:hypothetical protein